MFNNGGDFKTDGEWSLNSPQNVETLTFLKDLSTKYKVTNENAERTNHDDGTFPLFQQGLAGMTIGFGPLSNAIDAQFPDLNYGIAPMPTNDGKDPRTYGITDYLMAFKKKDNQDALQAFYSQYYRPDQINTWIKAEGFLPVTTSGIKEFASEKALTVYLETLPNIQLAPTNDPNYNKVKLTIQAEIGLVLKPGGDPQKFLDQLQELAVSQ
jgi:multiple sugar transport system substrate-binding protein